MSITESLVQHECDTGQGQCSGNGRGQWRSPMWCCCAWISAIPRNGPIADADRRVCQRSNASPEQEHPRSRAGASISLASTATRRPLRSRSSGRKVAATVTLQLGQRPSCLEPRTCWVLAVVLTNCCCRLSSARCKVRSDPLPWRCRVQSATLFSRGGGFRDPRWPIVRLTLGRQPSNIPSCEKIAILRATCAK